MDCTRVSIEDLDPIQEHVEVHFRIVLAREEHMVVEGACFGYI